MSILNLRWARLSIWLLTLVASSVGLMARLLIPSCRWSDLLLLLFFVSCSIVWTWVLRRVGLHGPIIQLLVFVLSSPMTSFLLLCVAVMTMGILSVVWTTSNRWLLATLGRFRLRTIALGPRASSTRKLAKLLVVSLMVRLWVRSVWAIVAWTFGLLLTTRMRITCGSSCVDRYWLWLCVYCSSATVRDELLAELYGCKLTWLMSGEN